VHVRKSKTGARSPQVKLGDHDFTCPVLAWQRWQSMSGDHHRGRVPHRHLVRPARRPHVRQRGIRRHRPRRTARRRGRVVPRVPAWRPAPKRSSSVSRGVDRTEPLAGPCGPPMNDDDAFAAGPGLGTCAGLAWTSAWHSPPRTHRAISQFVHSPTNPVDLLQASQHAARAGWGCFPGEAPPDGWSMAVPCRADHDPRWRRRHPRPRVQHRGGAGHGRSKSSREGPCEVL
jgi:hypothetical protein